MTTEASDEQPERQPEPEQEQPPMPTDEELGFEYNLLVKRNQKKMQRLGREGVQIGADQMMQVRLEMLIEGIIPVGTPDRMKFEYNFQAWMADQLEEVEKQVRMARMAPGAVPPQSLIIPGGQQ